ncbi:MAG: ketopantoate reductase family protein [Candidatus Thorarchaeota archaeon]
MKRIVVMGAGAIGSLYGGLMCRAGFDVILVARPPHVGAIRTDGLKITGILGEMTCRVEAVESARAIDRADIVFITTKSYDTVNAAREIRHLVDAGAPVVVLQNGLGTERLVERELMTTRVLRATTCMGAALDSPGHVNITGDGLTEVGSHHDENKTIVDEVVGILETSGFNVRGSDNMEGVVWTKTLVNCGINPVGALTGLTNGEIYRSQVLRRLVIRLVEETMQVVDALGVRLTTDNPIRYTLGTAKATGDNVNSMLQDIRARKRTEIDYLTGAVLKIAEDLGLDLPASQTVYALVKALESRYIESQDDQVSDMFLSSQELVQVIMGR